MIRGSSLSEILTILAERLPGIDRVRHVARGLPTIEQVEVVQTPAIFVWYSGSSWTQPQSNKIQRDATINLILVASGESSAEAEDELILLTENLKAWLRANERMVNRFGEARATSTVIERDGAFTPVERPELLRSDLTIRIRWFENYSSEVATEPEVAP